MKPNCCDMQNVALSCWVIWMEHMVFQNLHVPFNNNTAFGYEQVCQAMGTHTRPHTPTITNAAFWAVRWKQHIWSFSSLAQRSLISKKVDSSDHSIFLRFMAPDFRWAISAFLWVLVFENRGLSVCEILCFHQIITLSIYCSTLAWTLTKFVTLLFIY